MAWQSGHRTLTRLLGLPAPTSHYTVRHGLKIPMRDGVELLADHYEPTGAAKGTVLVRGPYGRGLPFSVLYTRVYAAHGYHVVMQSVRGTADSGGVFEPMIYESSDGADTVEWLRRQPWFTGQLATIGQSYLGFTQWALLMDPPPELAAAVITAGPHDFATSMWDTGAFRLTDSLGWSNLMAHQEHDSRLRGLIWAAGARRRLARATTGLPLGESARALLGAGASWFDSWLEHHDPEHPYWEPFRFGAALDRVKVPVLLIGGWQDTFLRQTLEQYQRLHDAGADVGLTVGPWTHAQLTTTGAGRAARESLEWLDRHLAGGDEKAARHPVRICITGDRWAELAGWPPPTSPRVLHLAPGGALTQNPPPDTGGSSSFVYDPANPTSIVGGPLMLAPKSGYRDDSEMAERADVLTFTSDPLPSDLYVMGSPAVEFAHGADIPHVDLFVRLSDVDERGRSRNVTDGYRRLTATPEPGDVRVELDPAAHRFHAGSRIRLLVAGGAHPLFSRNLGTGEPTITAQRLVAATHTVHHGAGGTSRLILPATATRPSADGAADPVGDSQ